MPATSEWSRTREWAPSTNDARHVLVLSGGFSNPKTGSVTLFARAQSGLPFTPIVFPAASHAGGFTHYATGFVKLIEEAVQETAD